MIVCFTTVSKYQGCFFHGYKCCKFSTGIFCLLVDVCWSGEGDDMKYPITIQEADIVGYIKASQSHAAETSKIQNYPHSERVQCKHKGCLEVFSNEMEFSDHLKKTFNHGHSQACVKCGKFFRSSEGYKIHYKTKHLGYHGNFGCNKCGRYFLTPTFLKQHMVSHSNERPHVCKHCKKSYKHKYEWLRHERTCLQQE